MKGLKPINFKREKQANQYECVKRQRKLFDREKEVNTGHTANTVEITDGQADRKTTFMYTHTAVKANTE